MMPGIGNDNLQIELFAYHTCDMVKSFLGTDGNTRHEQCQKGWGDRIRFVCHMDGCELLQDILYTGYAIKHGSHVSDATGME
eukprot:5622735-Ditylum_brightwellii.AAC.1